nr:WhiB family transcriptional regulator [Nocardia amikacinitolerans]
MRTRHPVREQCRDYALAADEPNGIWGGLTPRERVRPKWLHCRSPARDQIS